ncbi:EAL domain-containing response regulator [Bradyrhizobium sp.]|jgi:EAL domain-containing protein (putative c-di-GMP-specific phosphodiesterase class I)|uniref:EAL domain-containing response regulator n=1 Tax=Bradyrhizobium sp. TaxID=376 RepID=UPI003C1957B1
MRKISRQTENSKGRLLVVDDDVVQRTVIGMIAAKLGYDTVTASTFDVASELLQGESFDAMTLDLSLGEHDGVELLRLVAECGLQALPIVVISGCEERILNSTMRVAEGLALNLTGCLNKPLNLDKLRVALMLPPYARLSYQSRNAVQDITREQFLTGLEKTELAVEFQPKVDLKTGRVIGAEALARWRSAELGVVPPGTFIPAAERLGLMPELTNHILLLAIAQGRKLIEEHPGFTIAVNVSGSLMTDLALPERIESMLRAEQLLPASLIVEVTESVAMSDVDRATDILVRLRIKGIGAAIDDFGTGYSSLAALARLPFSELKIDQSFVKGCDSDEDMMKIIEASIGLGRAFKMKVVAEGIEDPRTLSRVREAGCDVGQGHLFAPSLRSERVAAWMLRQHSSGGGFGLPVFSNASAPEARHQPDMLAGQFP